MRIQFHPAGGYVVVALIVAACAEPTSVPSPSAISRVSSTAQLATGTQEIAEFPSGRVIVRFKSNSAVGLSIAAAARTRAIEAFAQRHGARPSMEMRLSRTWVLETTAGDEARLAGLLSEDPAVEWAEVDEPILLKPCETGNCVETNDPHRGFKWDLHNNGRIVTGGGTDLGATGMIDADIDWLEAYDALGDAFAGSATVGVIDTGILPTHQDLAGRVAGALNLAFGYPATLTQDRHSHGTHVAGIAAARGNNGLGLMGVAYAPNIKLLNAKACEWYDFGPPIGIDVGCVLSSVANAIVWATDNGAHVLNLSLGGGAGSAAQLAALQYARSKGVLPFCATGNSSTLTTVAPVSFPAAFAECVAVGATNWADARAFYSNAGPEMDLSAPGGDIASLPLGNSLVLAPVPVQTLTSPTTPETNNAYGWKAGTSMASPQAAGLAALLIASGVPSSEVIDRMKQTADDLGASGWDPLFGEGRINACRALDPALLRVEMPGSMTVQDASAIVPVTLFGSPRFTVDQFDLAVLTLGDGSGAETQIALRGSDYRAAIEDVDLDGMLDLSLKFSRSELIANGDLNPGKRTMVLAGNIGCRRVKGAQAVKVNK